MTRTATLMTLAALALLAGCSTTTNIPAVTPPSIAPLAYHPQAFCDGLVGQRISPVDIGPPSGYATIDSATLLAATEMRLLERGPTPASTIVPAMPQRCKVLGHVAPVDPGAPRINFQVNLPVRWTSRAVQYGGGGFNGTLITGEALVPAARFELPSPLARGMVTYGTDSGHQTPPGTPLAAFAANDEALVNFAHASYKKVRDVSVAIMRLAYGHAPRRIYFVGSSEGGREGLTMAQRYPKDFDGIFSRVPVINWTLLQHVGLRDGLALAGEGWIPPPKVKLVHDAVLAACDAIDGAADGLVSDSVGCRQRFDITRLRCTGAASDSCLSEAQVRAVQTLHSPLRFDIALANGVREYPGRGPSGENTASFGPTGGWQSWWTGTQPPAFPPGTGNGIGWVYGGGAIQHFYARNPSLDLRQYRAADHAARIRQVSELMDSTNPDLSAFHAAGGKLILLENMADYAQSPYAGIQYYQSVVQRMGQGTVDRFLKLYTAPNVDHVGTGAPANADFLGALVAWVEQHQAPAGLTLVEQDARPPFAVQRSRPLCEWPQVPRYRGGDINAAGSFACAP